MVAPWLATSVIAVKSTAYASIVGVWELTLASREVVERTIQPFPVFFGAMLIYFAICFPLSVAARRLQSATGDPA
jgi:polar amino acid transport system permease protein